jgi:hypothetical protein
MFASESGRLHIVVGCSHSFVGITKQESDESRNVQLSVVVLARGAKPDWDFRSRYSSPLLLPTVACCCLLLP